MTISWDLEGIHSLYIDGKGKIGWGELDYCPSLLQTSPSFQITARDGSFRALQLAIQYLPTELLAAFLLVSLLSLLLLAVWYMKTMELDGALPLRTWTPLAVAVAILCVLLGAAMGLLSIPALITALANLFATIGWQRLGAILTLTVSVALIYRRMRLGGGLGKRADWVAVAAFFVLALLLFAPFGFQRAFTAENWSFVEAVDGRATHEGLESATRFWLLVPHALSTLLPVDVFTSIHLSRMLMLWGGMVLLYGVLRQLRLSRASSFLIAAMALFYPVNAMLMSSRSLLLHWSALTLLAALYLALESRKRMDRLCLAGMWLALCLCIGIPEYAYAMILVLPALWWAGAGRPGRRRKINLSLVWYLFPVAKLLYMALRITVGEPVYGLHFVAEGAGSAGTWADRIGHYAGVVAVVYRQTFLAGWQEALAALGQNKWLAVTGLMLAVFALTSLYLWRKSEGAFTLGWRQSALLIAAGLVYVLPAIGVLMWMDRYSSSMWRIYALAPVGGALAVFGLVALLSSICRDWRHRRLIVIGLCALLMLPATSRLLSQHGFYVDRADLQARTLRQILEGAPALDPDALLILQTDMGLRELGDRHFYDFRRQIFDNAIYLLYQDARPAKAVFCHSGVQCHPVDWELKAVRIGEVVTDASKLVLMRLHDDLRVELLREIPPELGIANPESYNPDALIDYDAPLPPRAFTMLGAGS